MKQRILNSKWAGLLLVALVSITSARSADLKTLKTEAEESVTNFKRADPGLASFFDKAAGYAIIPSVGEGGFIIGGQHGEGLVYEKGNAVGKVKVSEVSVGAQVGGGAFSEIVFFETEEALKDFKKSKWDMSAKAKANVAASGVAANAKYEQGIAVFTLPKKGAMVAAAIGGQKFKFEPLPQ